MKISSIEDINVLNEKLELAEATLYLSAKKAERLTDEIATRQAKLVMTRRGVAEWTAKVDEIKARIAELEAAGCKTRAEAVAEQIAQAEALRKFHA